MLGSWGAVSNKKIQVRTSPYQGVRLCQTALPLEQQVVASPVFSATPSQREQASSAVRLPPRERQNAGFMVEHQLAQNTGRPTALR